MSMEKRCPECKGRGKLTWIDEDGEMHKDLMKECPECDGFKMVPAKSYYDPEGEEPGTQTII